MVDHVLDLKRTPFVMAGRAINTIQIQVLGAIKEPIRMGLRDCDVRSDGSVIINIAPDQAQALGKELLALARKGRFNVI
jgi:hypothetical protein